MILYAAILDKNLVMARNEAYLVQTGKKRLNYDNYRCPKCNKKVILIISQKKAAFFKHFHNSSNLMGEKEEHHNSKMLLKTALVAAGLKAQVEIPLANGQLRADVLASPELAFEIQCAPLSEAEFQHRHNLYKEIQVKDIWIVGKRHYLQKKIKKTQLMFFKRNQLWQTYYLEIDPTSHILRLKYNVVQEPITQVIYYQTKEFSLDEFGLQEFWHYQPDLKSYQLNPLSQKAYLNQQIRQKSKKGMRIAEKLYQKRLTLDNLPNQLFSTWRMPGEKNLIEKYLD